MAFCTKCGHKNPDGGRFCEECGAALASLPPAPPNHAQPAPVTADSSRTNSPGELLLRVGMGIGALIAIAGGLYFALAPEAASGDTFAKAIERSIAANPDLWRKRYCLDNFAYDKDPVLVNSYDGQTKRWLDILVKGGLYTSPEMVTSGSGFFSTTQLEYRKTDAGTKATKGSTLCIAEGVTVAKVESFTSPQKVGAVELSRATVKFSLRNPMPWTQSDDAKAMLSRSLDSDATQTIPLMLKDGKWEVASGEAVRNAARSVPGAKAAEAVRSEGFLDKLLGMFSFASSNPIVGKWSSNIGGIQTMAFEFRSDSMRTDSGVVNVRYKVEDHQVIVYPEGQSQGLIVRVIDKNTLSINMGLMDMRLERVDR